jgi:hypothetical protein
LGLDALLDALPPIELTHVDDDIGAVFLPCASPFMISVAGGIVPWNALGLDGLAFTEDDVIARCGLVVPYLHGLVLLDGLQRLGVPMWADEPMVTAMRVSRGSGGQQTMLTVDRLHEHHVVGPVAADSDDPWPGITAGALGHAAERMLVGAIGWALDSPAVPVETSVGRLFEPANEAGLNVRVLSPGDSVSLPGLTDRGRRELEHALTAGRYVIVPEAPVEIAGSARIGWWEYDPDSGWTIDRMDDGGHQAMADWMLVLKVTLVAVGCGTVALGLTIGTILVMSGLHMNSEGNLAMTAWMAAGGASCAMGFAI